MEHVVIGVLVVAYIALAVWMLRLLKQRDEARESEKAQYARYAKEYGITQEKNARVNELEEELRTEKVNVKALREENDALREAKKERGKRIEKLTEKGLVAHKESSDRLIEISELKGAIATCDKKCRKLGDELDRRQEQHQCP